ncbi:MAG TPA: DUF3365 domain-containing protein [Myxococcales bacterium]|jgi:general secretion pathway protein A
MQKLLMSVALVSLSASVARAAAPAAQAAAPAGQERTARLLADLLVAERAVVALNQPLINDASKADKGFSAEVFGAAALAEFKKRSGLDLVPAKPANEAERMLAALFEASKQAVAEAQPVINRPGMVFKGFTPAVFGLRTCELFLQKTGVKIKQTSARYRNALNRPDEFEVAGLTRLQDAAWKQGEGFGQEVEKPAKAYRYMLPVYAAKACLSCHGDPKGELDVAGRAKEGYQEGELRGAISVVLPRK